jgi:hypothetical protein
MTDEHSKEARLNVEPKVDARRTETVIGGTPTTLLERISSPSFMLLENRLGLCGCVWQRIFFSQFCFRVGSAASLVANLRYFPWQGSEPPLA